MAYPPHKSLNIVRRYWPLVRQALEAFPHVVELQNTGDVAFTTFVARMRDTISALQDYDYPGIKITTQQQATLAELTTKVSEDVLLVGNLTAVKSHAKKQPVGKAVHVSDVRVTNTLDQPSKEVLQALYVLLRQGIIDSVNITGITPAAVNKIIPDAEVMELNNQLTIYV